MGIQRIGVTSLAALALLAACQPPETEPEAIALNESAIEDNRQGVGWNVDCRRKYYVVFDPIVAFGVDPYGHRHEFFANRVVADSTAASLRNANSSNCNDPRKSDTSGYWAPALRSGPSGNYTYNLATTMAAYYRTSVAYHTVVPAPFGLKIIAGDRTASASNPQGDPHGNPNDWKVFWDCKNDGTGDKTQKTLAPINCPSAKYFPRAHVEFPQCWDGVNLDSADHKSHMAYPIRNTTTDVWSCPSTHPVAIPRLDLQINYSGPGDDGAFEMWNAELSSGDLHSYHADWINAWKDGDKGMSGLTANCINKNKVCGPGGF
jgi:hypothetical protein